MIKKGIQIYMVIMNGKHVDVLDVDQIPLKVTRTQRNLLTDVKNPNYIEDIQKEFGNSKILHNNYSVVKDGKTVYER